MGNSLANHNYEITEEADKHIPYNSSFCDFFQGRKIRVNGEVENLHRDVGIFAYQIDPETMSANKLKLISNGIMVSHFPPNSNYKLLFHFIFYQLLILNI